MASEQVNHAVAAANLDEAVGFALPARNARGRLVRLGPVLDEILSAHDYPAPIARILSEALVLTALLGATLKDAGGQLTLQAQTEAGIIDLFVCDYRGGELRGYVRFDSGAARRRDQPALALLPVRQGLSGNHLRPGGDQRALPGHRAARRRTAWPKRRSISSASPNRYRAWCVSPSTTPAISPAASCSSTCPRARRGASVCTRGSTIPNGSMSAFSPRPFAPPSWSIPSCRSKHLLWRLFHEEEEVRILSTIPLSKGCRCSLEYVREVIARFAPRRARADGRR